jgi:uncharacterized RDD family membrane protein YckC
LWRARARTVFIPGGQAMIYDLQKASMWKRISAFLCDMIVFCIVAVGIALLLSTVLRIDAQQNKMVEICDQYAKDYALSDFMAKDELEGALSITITEERYNTFTEEQKETFNKASEALFKNEDYLYAYGMVNQLILLVLTFSILITYLILEFAVPLLFQNGQTLGKKIFGVGVMRIDSVKISPLILLIRTVLGKYAVETMIPVFCLLSLLLGTASSVTTILLLLLAVAEVALLIFTQANTPLHDMLAGTVTVDFASQMIFDSPEELLEYKKRLHAEAAAAKKD